MNHVLRHLRRAALLAEGEGPPDEHLLEAFLARRDEAAFEALLRRHGPMVFGVCRRVLRNVHDAEDAFQATFLVLSRAAASIRSRQVVARWLYGVAYRTAMKARAMNAKRRTKERQASERTHCEATEDTVHEELLARLDQELSRLPEKYRVPVVLCELEGRSRKEAAHQLGLPEGTLSWRLAQAKKMLAQRLSRHGMTLSVGAVATVMAEGFSPTLRASTLKTVFSAGSVPAKVLALTEGVMKAMLLSKLKITMCAATLMLAAGIGATGLTYRATAQQPGQEAALESRSQADELEALRLEIEALRKSLQATREDVKTLRSEVSSLRGQREGSGAKGMGGGGRMGPGPGGSGLGGLGGRGGLGRSGMHGGSQANPGSGGSGPMGPGSGGFSPSGPGARGAGQGTGGGMQGGRPGQGMGGMMLREPSDPVSDAEAALKKLKANPGDKKATEALERALKRLKEREKPDQPGEQKHEQR